MKPGDIVRRPPNKFWDYGDGIVIGRREVFSWTWTTAILVHFPKEDATLEYLERDLELVS